ncbi:hypothetical protein [Caballeronia zhejiangensis]|uniref:Uncharacterized protein n=1 Tax=Caballeronia zhejiangensis TaxID=871203 RepID=A0A656QF73_9BURK|nr:hypothetical protein BURK_009161 [Burkholderia sp. SJ98]KDR25534.1 hypothetical protein BG60_28070 [Caballeronia zhejiangensis]
MHPNVKRSVRSACSATAISDIALTKPRAVQLNSRLPSDDFSDLRPFARHGGCAALEASQGVLAVLREGGHAVEAMIAATIAVGYRRRLLTDLAAGRRTRRNGGVQRGCVDGDDQAVLLARA